jgi:hypothetical protein
VPLSVAANAATSNLSIGALTPGQITVSALAFGVACPAQGTPSVAPTYQSDPVSATVIAGVVTSIPLELRAVAQGSTNLNFEVPAVSIATGANTSYAVLADGTVRAWGDNSTAELGAVGSGSALPVKVAGITTAVQVSAGNGFACVLLANQGVECFGTNTNGQLGVGYTSTTPLGPTVVTGLLATKISSNAGMTCALGLGGTEGCWGTWMTASAPGSAAQAGVYSLVTTVLEPTPDWVHMSAIADIAAGGDSPCYVTSAGFPQCDNSASLSLEGISSSALSAITHVAVGTGAACATQANGQVWCWGIASSGQLGNATMTSGTSYAPPQAIAALNGATSIALNQGTTQNFSCAALANGSVVCAGQGASGELGNGTASALITAAFVPVTGLTGVVQVAAGASHACARTYDGGVYCWGSNASGQLGDGTFNTRFVPVPVAAW